MTNRLAMVSLLISFLYLPVFSQITYVSENGTGDGTSWSQSAGDLEQILLNAESGDEIWVSAGMYRPDECSDCDREDREDRFEIPNQVRVYGGFSGTETQRNQRDWINNETILSGDIDQDEDPDDNSFTIVYFENVDSTTVIDGFTIRDGSAADDLSGAEDPGRSGAAIYNNGNIHSAPTIRNCKFIDHFADAHGAAIFNNGRNGGSAKPLISNCSFFGNYAIRSGGAIYNDGGYQQGESNPVIDHCFFEDNTSIFGGAMYNNGFGGTSAPRITNTTFTKNTGTSIAGAVYSFAKDDGLVAPIFANCLFVDNFGKSAGAVYTLASGGEGRPLLFNCIFYENSANTGGSVYCNESPEGNVEVTMYNNIFFGNTANHNPIFHMSGNGTPTMNLHNTMIHAPDCEDIMQRDDTDSLFCGAGIIYDEDPLFVDPANFDFRLQPGSPAVDAGENQIVIDNNIFYDIDSLVRILNGQVDMGIFELNNTSYVPTNFTDQPDSQTICENDDVLFNTETNGTAPASYQWYKNNEPLSGADGEDLFINNAMLSDTGTYYLEITTATGEILISDVVSLGALELATPSLFIIVSEDEICANTQVTFTISDIEFAGENPSYQWLRNDEEVGSDQPAYTTQSLSDEDEIRCVLTSSRNCLTTDLVFSNSIYMEVSSMVTPAISITADVSEICAEESVTFNADIDNEGDNPQIEWLRNGTVIQLNTTDITLTDLSSEDTIEAKIISSESCAISQPVFSNEITINVTELSTLNIIVTPDHQTVCEGETVLFTATTENAGSDPVYQWFINDQEVGISSPSFSADDLNNNDQVRCRIISLESCLNENVVSSQSVEIKVNPRLEVAAEISADRLQSCEGDSINFSATIVNGGTSPDYEWLINGVEIGQNTSTFSTTELNNGDQVSFRITSDESCLVNNSITTTAVVIQVEPILNLTVSISANVTTICEGELVTFTANPVNAGLDPDYQWLLNGVEVGSNTVTYTTASLTQDDQVSCRILSNNTCLASNVITSETMSIDLIELVIPNISVTASATEICENEPVTFAAQIIDGGDNPDIQWYKNDVEIGTGEMSLTLDQLNSNDTIKASVISSSGCASSDSVVSQNISVSIIALQSPSVEITTASETACVGEMVTFTAITENEGDNPTYLWTINGVEVTDNNMPVLQQTLDGNAEVTCTIVSDKICLTENTVSSEIYTVMVAEIIDPAISIVLAQDSICANQVLNFSASIDREGNNPAIEWFLNGTATGNNGEFFTTDNLLEGDRITAVLSVTEECTTNQSVTSNEVNINFSDCNIVGIATIVDNKNINIFPNPAVENFEIQFTDFHGQTEINIYDLLGQIVFQKQISISQNVINFPVDVRSFPSGSYFISVKNKNTNSISRIIVR